MKKVVNGDGCNLSRRHGGRGQRDGKSAYNRHYLDECADLEGHESLHAHLVTSLYTLSQPLAVYKNHILTLLYHTTKFTDPTISTTGKSNTKKTSKNSRLNAPSPPKSSQLSSPDPSLSPASHLRNTLQRSWHQSLHANRAGSSDLSNITFAQ